MRFHVPEGYELEEARMGDSQAEKRWEGRGLVFGRLSEKTRSCLWTVRFSELRQLIPTVPCACLCVARRQAGGMKIPC